MVAGPVSRFTIGVDPGSRETGIVARQGRDLLGHQVVRRTTKDRFPDVCYIDEVLCAIWRFGKLPDARGGLLAIEGVEPPNPHLGMSNPTGVMGTSIVLGAVMGEFRHSPVVLVEPAAHGQAPLRTYPPELIGEKERRGAGRLRHCRSAWDIARAGATRAQWAQFV